MDFLEIEGKIAEALKNVYDPEIPVNVYDLGLIYEIDVTEEAEANIKMTLTAPNCPMVDMLLADVEEAVLAVEGVEKVNINLVFDPPWEKSMLSEEAKLELGFL
ncbi:MAG: iron-sulfur cluster assembly protein [Bacteroidales bacterium]